MTDLTEAEKIEIFSRMEELEKISKRHDIILSGPNDSEEVGGLRYSVMENTRFRSIMTRWLWIQAISVSGLIVERILTLLGFG